jgi:hypothetical protein
LEWSEWKGKRIFLILNSNHNYSGKVIDADDKFISIIDKFGSRININTSEIKIIKEEGV